MWSQIKSIRSLSAVLRSVTFFQKVVGSPDDSCGAGMTSSEAHFGGMVPGPSEGLPGGGEAQLAKPVRSCYRKCRCLGHSPGWRNGLEHTGLKGIKTQNLQDLEVSSVQEVMGTESVNTSFWIGRQSAGWAGGMRTTQKRNALA